MCCIYYNMICVKQKQIYFDLVRFIYFYFLKWSKQMDQPDLSLHFQTSLSQLCFCSLCYAKMTCEWDHHLKITFFWSFCHHSSIWKKWYQAQLKAQCWNTGIEFWDEFVLCLNSLWAKLATTVLTGSSAGHILHYLENIV